VGLEITAGFSMTGSPQEVIDADRRLIRQCKRVENGTHRRVTVGERTVYPVYQSLSVPGLSSVNGRYPGIEPNS
jgi:hypothetical protein